MGEFVFFDANRQLGSHHRRHRGAPYTLADLVADMREFHIGITTTFVPWPGAISEAVRSFGAEKVLSGSDFPDLDVSLNLGPLLTARISDEDKQLVLGRNMHRLLLQHGGIAAGD